MATKVAINGFGRIGRAVTRILMQKKGDLDLLVLRFESQKFLGDVQPFGRHEADARSRGKHGIGGKSRGGRNNCGNGEGAENRFHET